MWTFLEVFILWKKCFQHGNHHSYFLHKLCVLNCALPPIYHCLFWVQKIRNQKFSAIFKRSNVKFSYYFFEQRAFKHIFTFVLMQMCACLKEHMRFDYVFCALCMVCPGSAVSWNRQGCSRQSIEWVQNNWSVGTGLLLNSLAQM